jgi:Mn2+/Fe2+ NRAMP family transporter
MAWRDFFSKLGPGLVTGAADDDPSAIATYSQLGAQFGYAMLWVTVFTIPLMTAAQLISAQVARVTGKGIAHNMRHYYPAWVLRLIVMLMLIANIINLAADIGAMGQALRLLVGGPPLLYASAARCSTSPVSTPSPRSSGAPSSTARCAARCSRSSSSCPWTTA